MPKLILKLYVAGETPALKQSMAKPHTSLSRILEERRSHFVTETEVYPNRLKLLHQCLLVNHEKWEQKIIK